MASERETLIRAKASRDLGVRKTRERRRAKPGPPPARLSGKSGTRAARLDVRCRCKGHYLGLSHCRELASNSVIGIAVRLLLRRIGTEKQTRHEHSTLNTRSRACR